MAVKVQSECRLVAARGEANGAVAMAGSKILGHRPSRQQYIAITLDNAVVVYGVSIHDVLGVGSIPVTIKLRGILNAFFKTATTNTEELQNIRN